MRISRWAETLATQPALKEAITHLDGSHAWHSIALEARPFLLAGLYHRAPRKILIVTANYDRALQWQAKLQLCGIPDSIIHQLPSGLSALFEDASPEYMALSDRIGALRFLVSDEPGVVIATASAALERTLPSEVIKTSFRTLQKGQSIDQDELILALSQLGYEPAEPVRLPGQYSRRGGILDVFAMGSELPVRIDFFGDEIDSLRQFDINSQRSIGPVSRLHIGPSRETMYYFPDITSVDELAAARNELSAMVSRMGEIEAAELGGDPGAQLDEAITQDARAIAQGVFFDRLDLYRPLMHPDASSAVDLLPESGLLVLDEPSELEMLAGKSEAELSEALSARHARGEILHSVVGDFAAGPEHLGTPPNRLALLSLGAPPPWFGATGEFDVNGASLDGYRGRPDALVQTIQTWLKAGFRVVMTTDQPTRARSVLNQVELTPNEGYQLNAEVMPDPAALYLAQGNLAGGFSLPDARLAIVTDHELFGVGRLKLPQRRFNEGVPIATVLDLKPGDYVVHINYGIGIFQGLVMRKVGDLEKECLYIQYAGPDKLYVPADQLDRVQKYLTPGDAEPKIHRLHSGDWQRAVGKAREEAREFARDLIRLYAERKKAERPSLGPESPWQAEMEATFPWMETPSQLKAIKEVKADLKTPYPMDRLICGDVGFGKTEVAIRAAFMTAQAGRQVVVLCPTTILSEQHFRSFEERLGSFPIRLDFLNRFRSTAERKEIINDLEKGEIDIIIGTHALLSKDLKFKDLGLVIIDEEHKFGVKHKEALKELRVHVDVLSMSATPIPRTLSMALMDIRPMSLINDPPPGRLPIRTFVRPYSNEVVREAILREMARGGQVYYVFNRVSGIYHAAEKVKKLVPMARIGVGHGQMTEKELEPVIHAFFNGELDVLLSTTIIENGLDIANANTMIVENADRLGLSQLYQLRGRVGRSDRQAYAYLLYQNEGNLTDNAMARLQSLREFTSLGSGYSLAFRDLQIRGAGELLGAKQSGTMASVGYELFAQIIQEEVQFLKSHADREGTPRGYNDPLEGLQALPTIDIPLTAIIPDQYVEEQAQRLYYYRAMMSSRSDEELDAVADELADRYGKRPAVVENALRLMRCRMRAAELSMKKIDGNGGRLAVEFEDSAEFPPRLWSLLNKTNKQCFVARSQFIWPFVGEALLASEDMLRTFRQALEQLEADRRALSGEPSL